MLPQAEICSILAEIEGNFAVYVEDLDEKEVFTINGQQIFPSASIIKVPLLAVLLNEVKLGKISLNEQIEINDDNRVSGTGILRSLNNGYKPTLRDLAILMVVLSDNIATNQIIDIVGMDKANAYFKEIGLKNTLLQRKMFDEEGISLGKENFTSVNDMGYLLKLIEKEKILTPYLCKTIINIMKGQQLGNLLPALLPRVPFYASDADKEGPPPEGKVIIAHKTGDLPSLKHDMGIFYLPDNKSYILVIFTSNLTDEGTAISIISKLSLAVYEALA